MGAPRRLLVLYEVSRGQGLPVEFSVDVASDLSSVRFVVEDVEFGHPVPPVDELLAAIDKSLTQRFHGRPIAKSEAVGGPIFTLHP